MLRLKKNFKVMLAVIVGSLIIAININTFVSAGELVPGGLGGLTILVQRIFEKYLSIQLPYTLVNVLLNLAPFYIGFRFIGKKFTIYSFFAVIFTSVFVDILPKLTVTQDILLISVFGGIANGVALSLILSSGASSGGTDFVAMYISKKTNKSAWNYILAFNTVMLITDGVIFGWDKALYSIIFQFVSTNILNSFYKRYQQMTLMIITKKPEEVAKVIHQVTHHGATEIEGYGSYSKQEKTMLYTVINASDVKLTLLKVREVDPKVFVNVMKSEFVEGRFYQKPIE